MIAPSPTATPARPNARCSTHSMSTWRRSASSGQHGQPARAALNEQQRIGDGTATRGDHPGGEIDDEPAELRPRAACVARAEHALDDRLAGEREEPGRGRDERQRDPGRRDHVPRDPLRRRAAPRERHGRDERDRGRSDRNEERGDQVRVRERRAAARAETRREAQRDHIEDLQRERQRDALAEQSSRDQPGPSGRPTPPRHTSAASGTPSVTAPFTASPQPKAITPWSMKRIVTSTPITEPRANPNAAQS